MGDALVVYVLLSTAVTTLLIGMACGYWIRRGEDHLRRRRDAHLIEGLRAQLAPTTPKPSAARRGRHAAPKKEATPDE